MRDGTVDWIGVALIGLPIAGFVIMGWRWRWTHDDGFITMRVVDQVFAGNGPVYNAGQRVEVFTSPLHLFLLVVLRGLFGWALDQAWLGVILTMGSAVAGLGGAVAGAARLARAGGAKGRLLPFGLLVLVALPPMWEYATSGLETGIAIGWVGLSFWLLARLVTRPRPRPADRGPAVGDRGGDALDEPAAAASANGETGVLVDRAGAPGPRIWPTAMVLGLGPLVRPEGSILAVGFVVVLLTSAVVGPDRRRRLRLLGAAIALPVAYEVFRMGYYAALVPNTALAKEAGASRWDQGWYYLVNFSGPYLVVIPLAAFGAWLAFGRRWSITRSFGGVGGRNLALMMVLCAALQTLYVVRVGGDYMHARMLLMPMFALCCPLAVVALPRAERAAMVVVACVALVAGWAALVALAQRAPDPEGFFGGHSIAEQRIFYAKLAGNPHPVSLEEWKHSFLYRTGDRARAAKAAGRDVLITDIGFGGVSLGPETPLPPGRGPVLFLDGIGVAGERAGTDIPVIDLHGLADPLASRTPALVPRGLPGHEKALPQEWALAEAGAARDDPAAGAAALAITCGDIGRLLDAIDGPATPSVFLRNLFRAPGLTTLAVPKDPADAARSCGRP